jgi:hypothetical protein
MRDDDTSYSRDDESYVAFSEAHKDVFHYRPRLEWLRSLTDEEYKIECDLLSLEASRQDEEERAEFARAAQSFEAHITDMMKSNGIDRKTAIRWDFDAMGLTKDDLDFYGLSQYAYLHSLKTTYFDKIAA